MKRPTRPQIRQRNHNTNGGCGQILRGAGFSIISPGPHSDDAGIVIETEA